MEKGFCGVGVRESVEGIIVRRIPTPAVEPFSEKAEVEPIKIAAAQIGTKALAALRGNSFRWLSFSTILEIPSNLDK